MRIALYIRVSSDKQAKEGDSIPAQLEALRRYAKEQKHIIAGEYIDDGISGTKYTERDELQRMLSDVRERKIDLIAFTKLDRFYRSIRHYTATQAILDEYKVPWLAIWEPIYDTTTPAGRLIVNQMMSIAQFEAENTGQRIRQVQAYKVKQREVISGNCSVGYSIINKHLIVNEESADIVRAFETYDRTNSLADTVRAMQGTSLPISTNGMKQLLQRRIYLGEAHGLKDFCEPIIDRELFDRVQIKLSRNIKKNQKYTYLFSGLIRCKECGSVLAAQSMMRRGKRKMVYRCAKHYQRQIEKCPNAKVIYEDVLERMLLEKLPDMIIDRVEIHEKESAPSTEKQRAAIERRIERLKELYIADEISMEEYKQDKHELLVRLEELAPEARQKTPEAILSLKGMDIQQIYKNLDLSERRTFWRGIIKSIYFDIERNFYFDFV